MTQPDNLKQRQDAADEVYERMLAALIGFDPCGKLTVADVQYIARLAQTYSFDAFSKVSSS